MSNHVPENTRQGYRRRNYRRRSKSYHKSIEYKKCPICGKAVKSMLTAIAVNEEMDPAHFDCVIKQITDKENIGKGEKVTYLGNGTFAVIKIKSGSRGTSFTVIKKIQYEDKEKQVEWRKKISWRLKR